MRLVCFAVLIAIAIGDLSFKASVEYRTQDETAIAGKHYQETHGVLEFDKDEVRCEPFWQVFVASLFTNDALQTHKSFTVHITPAENQEVATFLVSLFKAR